MGVLAVLLLAAENDIEPFFRLPELRLCEVDERLLRGLQLFHTLHYNTTDVLHAH